jgi:gliding-associated putative ABC transporter substrate-binding component GldG
MDIECSSIPQIIGMQGDQPQIELFDWYYHPLVTSRVDHPIVKNIDRVNLYFPSSIDTVKTELPILKTPLLLSSNYSRVQYNPMRLSFEILKLPQDPAKFNKPNQIMALLLEGEFSSAYKNRLTPEFKNTLSQIGLEFKEKSKFTRQIVVAESDFVKNMVSDQRDIGYNMWDKKYYKGNKDFILNAIEYLMDEDGILKSRSKEIKLRLLDSVKTQKEKTKWQMINLVFPLIFLLLFGLLFHYIRKRKYAS